MPDAPVHVRPHLRPLDNYYLGPLLGPHHLTPHFFQTPLPCGTDSLKTLGESNSLSSFKYFLLSELFLSLSSIEGSPGCDLLRVLNGRYPTKKHGGAQI